MKKKLNIGLFGFGVVGHGLYDVLDRSSSLNATIKRICVKDKNKSRDVDLSLFTFDKDELLNDKDIDVIVELIDNADDAFQIVKAALQGGKAVVTANKKMISENIAELYQLQQDHKVPLLYEGAACGSIPIIRNLEEYYDNDLLSSLETICNGTTNYIFTKMAEEGIDYLSALKGAQRSGFAESNPRLDVKAFDPKYKLSILLAHAFGVFVDDKQIFHFGIDNVSEHDFNYAKKNCSSIKLIAGAYKEGSVIKGYVLPHLVNDKSMFYKVRNEFNAVQLSAAFSDIQFFYGKGAGAFPTASAVLADISALSYNYKYEYKKHNANKQLKFSNEHVLKLYIRYHSKEQLAALQPETVEEYHSENGVNYVIANVKVQNLLSLNVNEWTDLFLAKL